MEHQITYKTGGEMKKEDISKALDALEDARIYVLLNYYSIVTIKNFDREQSKKVSLIIKKVDSAIETLKENQ